jgi:hypothetical protein
MRLLALDLGTSCGWALFESGQRVASGTWSLDQDRTRDRGDVFLARVESFVKSHRIDVVAHEHVASLHQHTSADAAHLFGGWLMLLAMIRRRTTARIYRVETPSVQAASGAKLDRRRAPKGATEAERKRRSAERRENNKQAVIDAARARGWQVGDDDEADACFVGVAALAEGAGS